MPNDLRTAGQRLADATDRWLNLEERCEYVDDCPEVCPGIATVGNPCHWCEARTAVAAWEVAQEEEEPAMLPHDALALVDEVVPLIRRIAAQCIAAHAPLSLAQETLVAEGIALLALRVIQTQAECHRLAQAEREARAQLQQHADAAGLHQARAVRLAEENAALLRRNDKLIRYLMIYGQHDTYCAHPGAACDCGWATVLRELERESSDAPQSPT